MAGRIVDPDRFILNAAIVDWGAINSQRPDAGRAEDLAKRRGISTRLMQLRWLMDPKFGYPTEPFKVWRRASKPMQAEKSVPFETYFSLPGCKVYAWSAPLVFIRTQIVVTGATAAAIAYSGAPFSSDISDWRTLVTGWPGHDVSCRYR
jgi:hypothetical protein